MEDSTIVAMYFARDQRAISCTDEKYGKPCFNLSYNILNDRGDAEECVNDTYLGVWNAIPPTRPKSFRAFIYDIVKKLSFKRLEYKLAAKRASNVTVSFDELEKLLPAASVSEDFTAVEIGELVGKFLQGEKPLDRIVFMRRYFYFDSVGEIAGRYSVTESTVKNSLARTRGRLRKYLEKAGVTV